TVSNGVLLFLERRYSVGGRWILPQDRFLNQARFPAGAQTKTKSTLTPKLGISSSLKVFAPATGS
ncbi:hypothetical protein O5833_29755, partial [Escherichia coli]|nr:hypothetical protein [Escherichia coli]